MTDLEIDKALALAIGWKPEQIHTHLHGTGYAISIIRPDDEVVLRVFSHKDWNVIGPIAEWYDCFPSFDSAEGGWWSSDLPFGHGDITCARTPQRAIAMAVIQGAKK